MNGDPRALLRISSFNPNLQITTPPCIPWFKFTSHCSVPASWLRLTPAFDPAPNGFRIRPSSWLEIPGFLGDHVGRCLNCLYLSISKSNRCWFIQFRTLICIYLLNYIISSYPNASLKPRSFNKFQQGPDLIWTSAVGMQQTSALNLSALIMLHLLLVGVGSVVRFGLNWAGWF